MTAVRALVPGPAGSSKQVRAIRRPQIWKAEHRHAVDDSTDARLSSVSSHTGKSVCAKRLPLLGAA